MKRHYRRSKKRRKHIEVCGVNVVLFGSEDFDDLVKAIAAEGEDVSHHPYIILSKQPILPSKRQEVRDWYGQYLRNLVEKGKSPKRSVRRQARKKLYEIGWVIDWNKITK